jgi:hypothetical protein
LTVVELQIDLRNHLQQNLTRRLRGDPLHVHVALAGCGVSDDGDDHLLPFLGPIHLPVMSYTFHLNLHRASWYHTQLIEPSDWTIPVRPPVALDLNLDPLS